MTGQPDDPMWSLVLFDLPVLTRPQRTEATRFRNLLLDLAYQRVQLSVYARFSPTAHSLAVAIKTIKRNVPLGGELWILALTDHQWSSAIRISTGQPGIAEEASAQLALF
jgi:CRISPR-associated protein Cas2